MSGGNSRTFFINQSNQVTRLTIHLSKNTAYIMIVNSKYYINNSKSCYIFHKTETKLFTTTHRKNQQHS